MEYAQSIYQMKRYFTEQPRKGLLLIACGTMLSGCSSLNLNGANDQCNRADGAEVHQAKEVAALNALSASPHKSDTTSAETAKKPTQTIIAPPPKDREVFQSAARAANNVVRPAAASLSASPAARITAPATFKKPEPVIAKTTIKAPISKPEPTKKATNTVSSAPEGKKQPTEEDSFASTAQNFMAKIATATGSVINSGSEETTTEVSVTTTAAVAVSKLNSAEEVNLLIEANPTAAGEVEAKSPVMTTKKDPIKKPEPKIASTPKVKAKTTSLNNNRATKGKYGIWKVEQNWDGQHPGVCRLSTSTRQLENHDFSAQLWLNVIDDVLLVNTTTNINIKQKGVGIQANNGKLQRFSKNVYSDSAAWSGSLAKTLKSSKQLKIVIGGSEVGKKNLATSIDLKDLKKAYSAYNKCNS